ncbi:MAG: AAA family ATPase [Coleofasciculus sp. B1-GNL1-01]|uniref:P-loop NTPase fold protein n=1 Tax=Coleofasciculus sp. B1-GNL1-01 TaxID=3068484 RepID=UPI0032F2A3D5
MKVELQTFFKATNPSRTLVADNPEDQKFYIDFSPVRGGKIIEELKDNITFFSPDEPTCALFTGHIGCGKSTELLRLKAELEADGFHVVYFESSEDLEMADVDIGDVLLAIARRISQSLQTVQLGKLTGLQTLVQGAARVLNAEVQGVRIKVPNLGDVGVVSQNDTVSLAFGIGEITAKTKSDAMMRQRLNQYLGPQKTQLLQIINQELIEPAIAKLKQQGKKGLVVIVDNLDRIDNSPKPWGRPQQDYLFVDQSECLTKLYCHLVYTMPLALKFSDDYGVLTQRFPERPKILPMVPVQLKDGSDCQAGIRLLRQMVLARAFPDLTEQERLENCTEIFDTLESLDYLCYRSGGHVRDLLKLLNDWIKKERKFPLSRPTLDKLVRQYRNEMTLRISDNQWELLRQVQQRKWVSDDQGYELLIRSRLVFEYYYEDESWFDVNPILVDAQELQG